MPSLPRNKVSSSTSRSRNPFFRYENAERSQPYGYRRTIRLSVHSRHGCQPQPEPDGTESENVYYVGNILIDAIRYNRNRLLKPIWFSVLGLQEGNYLLFTLNRRVLLGNKENLRQLMKTIIDKSAGMPIVAPLPYLRT